MNESFDDREQTLFDFVEQFCVDAASGRPPPLSHYLARFPGYELSIATEYVRLLGDEPPPASAPSPPERGDSSDLWRRLEARRAQARYAIAAQIARGGMGTIHRARDVELERDVAVKLVRRDSPRAIERLLCEARVTGRLDHPGVVPIHDLGVDGDGRLFFTMRLVQGRDLALVIDALHAKTPPWTLARVLEVLVKVCDTMAFAHSRGIVHRDLKPANVRVGEFGEVYVLDWGLARDLREPRGVEPLRIAAAPALDDVGVRASESPLFTVEGDVLGTPYYMPPEQARGDLAAIDARADVYATGAMLYHALAGRPPYASREGVDSPREVLERVRAGAPRELGTGALGELESSAPEAPRELLSICAKAMHRDPAERYADMRDFARDLRAFLDRRVVSAHESGPWAELRAWSRRNRALSASFGALFALGLWGAWLLHQSDVEAREHLRERLELQDREQSDLELFQDVRAAAGLEQRFDELWPATDRTRAALEAWLGEAEPLIEKRAARQAELEALRARAEPADPNAPDEVLQREARARDLARLRDHRDYYEREFDRIAVEGGTTIEGEDLAKVAERFEKFSLRIASEEARPFERLRWTFAASRDQTRHDLCAQFLDRLDALLGAAGSRSRLDVVRDALVEPLGRATPPASSPSWTDVAAELRETSARLVYGDVALAPQRDLVPLGRDPSSGLEEFACESTGSIPRRGRDGVLELEHGGAIVLVLVPGGELMRGAQASNPEAPNFDPRASSDEQPIKVLPIDPYFLAKFELTRAQWERIAGDAPWSKADNGPLEDPRDRLAPASNISWNQARRALARVRLELPTEAQWEWAARTGLADPMGPMVSAGLAAQSSAGNFYDRAAARSGEPIWRLDGEAMDADDGAALLARVGSYCPNALGLHDLHGNVGELCRDAGALGYVEEVALGSLERVIHPQGVVVWRGGSFASGPSAARASARHYCGPDSTHDGVGVRAARTVER